MTSVRISTTSGRIHITAEDREGVEVGGDAEVTVDGDRTTIHDPTASLVVRVPLGSDLAVGTQSGRVTIDGVVGDIAVITESGTVDIDRAGAVDVRSGSGRVRVREAAGLCRIRTTRGRVEVGGCAGAHVSTESGRVDLREIDGPARAHCVNGRIELEMARAADIDAATVSGRIRVSLPPDVEAGVDFAMKTSSISGGIEVINR